jgi:hypothetical protein
VLTVRDLNRDPHPILDEIALGALFTPAGQRTPEQTARVALDDALIAEIASADVVVLGVPMYNFGVPAQFKNWIDAISRAGVTFRYTANGPEGPAHGQDRVCRLDAGRPVPEHSGGYDGRLSSDRAPVPRHERPALRLRGRPGARCALWKKPRSRRPTSRSTMRWPARSASKLWPTRAPVEEPLAA